DQTMTKLEAENRHYYRETLANGGHIACFALLHGEIIGCGGMCLYQEMPSPDNLNGKCAYLMNIYTRPAFRSHGVGKRVVCWLIRQAKEKSVTKIYLEASEAGRPLYREMGFADMTGYMKWKEDETDPALCKAY